MILLEIEKFTVSFTRDGEELTPVPGVDLSVNYGERVALVGESGCGKSLTALGITALAPTNSATLRGNVKFAGKSLINNVSEIQKARHGGIAYVFQDPIASLNPVMRIDKQIVEAFHNVKKTEIRQKTISLLNAVGLNDAERIMSAFPCELSGGQCQRIMIAMALASEPELLIADEPTTALDVTTQRQILELIDKLAKERNMAVLLITHNLGLVATYFDRVYVMYAGRIVEYGNVVSVLENPQHPYTKGLLGAVPSLDESKKILQDIPGTVPPVGKFPEGCSFNPRCKLATDECRKNIPGMTETVNSGVRCFHRGENS